MNTTVKFERLSNGKWLDMCSVYQHLSRCSEHSTNEYSCGCGFDTSRADSAEKTYILTISKVDTADMSKWACRPTNPTYAAMSLNILSKYSFYRFIIIIGLIIVMIIFINNSSSSINSNSSSNSSNNTVCGVRGTTSTSK